MIFEKTSVYNILYVNIISQQALYFNIYFTQYLVFDIFFYLVILKNSKRGGGNINTGRLLRWVKKRKYIVLAIVCVLVALTCCLGLILSARAIPKACAAHEKRVRAEISKRVYESVKYVTSQMSQQICNQTVYDENGYISHVSLDFVKINEICNFVVTDLSNSFLKDPKVYISVPIGSALGINVFSGKGPGVNVAANVYPTFSAKIESSFTAAGINQTLHELTLTVSCDIVSVCVDETIEISESYDFNIHQSIIVGSVPFA